MYECLVGYTPFYADDPVTTCKKILKWQQCLHIPEEVRVEAKRRGHSRALLTISSLGQVRKSVSPQCLSFMACLLAGPDKRASQFEQIVKHPWFAGFDWEGIHERPGPLIPTGCEHMDEVRKRGAAISEGSRKGKGVCDVRNDREADSPTPAYTLTSTNSSFTPLTDARVPQALSEE